MRNDPGARLEPGRDGRDTRPAAPAPVRPSAPRGRGQEASSTSGSVSTMRRPWATSVSASAASRVSGRPDQPVQRGGRLRGDRLLGLAHELEHGVRERADLRRHAPAVPIAAEVAAGVREVAQRVLQQRVVGLEGLDQSFLLGRLGDELAPVALDAGAGAAVGAAPATRRVSSAARRPSTGLDQRIVVPQQPGARPQHVALQRGISRISACSAWSVRSCRTGSGLAPRTGVGQDQQQARDDRHQPPDRPGHGERPHRARGPAPVFARERAQERRRSGRSPASVRAPAELAPRHGLDRLLEAGGAAVVEIGRRDARRCAGSARGRHGGRPPCR